MGVKMEEETFCFAVRYKAFITEDTYVDAKTKEEAIKKIKENSNDIEVLDSHIEYDGLDSIEEYK